MAIFDHTINFLAYLSGATIVLVTLLIFTDVTVRASFRGVSLPWVIEISEYLMIYITFLGTTWLLKREGHVKMDLVVNRLTPRNQAMLNAATSIIGLILCLTLTWFGALVTWDYFQRGVYRGFGLIRPPIFIFLAIIPVGSFLLSIQFVRRAYGYLIGRRAPILPEEVIEF